MVFAPLVAHGGVTAGRKLAGPDLSTTLLLDLDKAWWVAAGAEGAAGFGAEPACCALVKVHAARVRGGLRLCSG